MEAPVPSAAKKVDEDEPKKKGMALIKHDLKQKELIPIKLLKFLILASINLIYYYELNYNCYIIVSKVWEF